MKFKRAAGAVLFILGLIALLGAASYVVLPRDNTCLLYTSSQRLDAVSL